MDVIVLLSFAFVVLVLVGYEQRRELRPKKIMYQRRHDHSRSYQNGALLHERLSDAKSSLRKYHP
jgi:hypothetical protein